MTDAELTQLLQTALNTDQIIVQAKRKDGHAIIMLNRDPALGSVDHDALAEWFKAAITSLQDPSIKAIALFSRERGQQDPDWKTKLTLDPPADQALTTPVDPSIPSAPEAPSEPDFQLDSYCFTRNELLLRTKIVDPHTSVATLVKTFHDFSTRDKAFLLPRMDAFLKNPTAIPLDPQEMSPSLINWLREIQELDEKKLRDFTIWLSRYCAYPDKTIGELGGPTPQSDAKPTVGDPSPSRSESGSLNKPGGSWAETVGQVASGSLPKAGRAAAAMPLKIASLAGNLALASGVTLSLLGGMVLVLSLAIIGVSSEGSLGLGWLITSIAITLIFSALVFFISPWIMDLTQRWLYGTQWVSLASIEQRSPETANIIRKVSAKYRLKEPRLGIIDDQNPTAFTYGNLPNSARIVVSEGLFTYLDDDEVAAVYAHELGHIVHWDFAVMTLAATLVQITYLLYVFIRDRVRGDSKAARNIRSLATVAYIFYIVGTYLQLYLSRVREYFADHFAAEVTGNPNGLSRALVKIAYGIVEVGERTQTEDQTNRSRRLLEGTRALGIYDARAAASTGTAYRVAERTEQVGKVFLWDMFNPWGFWMELSSTHPLTGKRIRALSNYAEQLGLPTEFDMAKIIAKGKQLDKRRLYGGFGLDLLLMNAPYIGILFGILLSLPFWSGDTARGWMVSLGIIVLCYGLGLFLKMIVMFPSLNQVTETTILRAMSNPYASPLRGIPMLLQGKIIGRGNAGYAFGSDVKMQDASGMIFLRYASRFGPLGNFLFGANQVKGLIGQSGSSRGWFRRGIMPWMDLAEISTVQGNRVTSHHPFWHGVGVGLCFVGGILLMVWPA